MKKIAVIIILIITSVQAQAQHEDYVNSIGLRGGLHVGVAYKHFFNSNTAIEGIVHSRWSGIEVVGLMEHHNELMGQDGLKWYYGYGAHLGFYNNRVSNTGDSSTMVIGADGILGIEFVIPNSPISISVDWKPYYNLIGWNGLALDGGAISVRYIFN